jgi:hypothetical protein
MASENRSTNQDSEPTEESREIPLDLPTHIPPDMSGGDSAIHMVPYKVGKVPSMAFRICDGCSVVDTFADISGCMSDWRNKGGRRGVCI